jgi:iron complex outermembrane receptor protein
MSDSHPAKDYEYDENGKIIGGSGENILLWSDARRFAYTKRAGKVEEVGSMQPDFLGGINTSLRYKNFTLRASFDMRFGGKVASYDGRYGHAYGYTGSSLRGRNEEHGGITWTSGFDGKTYHDGIIPEGILQTGTRIGQPDGSVYVVATGNVSGKGETYKELFEKGKIEPSHAGTWAYFNNSWGQGVLNDDWFVDLNYIAVRDISLSYQFSKNIAEKIHAKNLSVTAAAHNLGYLLNSMPNHENPEAVAGTTAAEFRIRQFSGITTNFTLTLNATF